MPLFTHNHIPYSKLPISDKMERFNAETPLYRTRSVYDLLSLKGKAVVITGSLPAF